MDHGNTAAAAVNSVQRIESSNALLSIEWRLNKVLGVVQLAEWSLPTPDDLSSNPAISYFEKEHWLTVNCWKDEYREKESEMAQLKHQQTKHCEELK